MLAEERRIRIEEILHHKNTVQLGELTQLFQVSAETVRRDLVVLEKAGRLQRTHGGAISNSHMIQVKELALRKEEFQVQKTELAACAATFVCENDTVAIDSGSTAIHFTKALVNRHLQNLTVITHSLDVMTYLSGFPEIQVILCGGFYMDTENAFYGGFVLDALEKLHANKAFLFPAAISLRNGLSDNNYELQQIQRYYLRICDQAFLLADSSKFEKTACLKLDALRPQYTLVTDSSLPDEIYQLYLDNKLNVIKVKGPML